MPITGFATYKHLLSVTLDNGRTFELPYQFISSARPVFADSITIDGNSVEASFGTSTISDMFEESAGIITVTRRWSIRDHISIRALFTVIMDINPERWIIPGAVYVSGAGLAGRAEGAGPIVESKTSIPSCGLLESSAETLAIFAAPAATVDDLSSITTYISEGHVEFSIAIPEENPDIKVSNRGSVKCASNGEWLVGASLSYERRFHIRAGAGGRSLNSIVDAAWNLQVYPAELDADWSMIVNRKAQGLVSEFFVERGDALGFVEKTGYMRFPVSPRLIGGSIGGNVESAHVLYRLGALTESRELKRIALDTADFFLAGEYADEKPHIDYHLGLRRWQSPATPDGILRNVSSIISSGISMHHSAGAGDSNPRWLFTIKKLIAHIDRVWFGDISPLAKQITDESSHDPNPHELTNVRPPTRAEAFACRAYADLFAATRERRYLVMAEWLADRLIGLIYDAFEPRYNEGPVATREEAHAMLRAFLATHSLTAKHEFLDAATRAASYLRSLCFTHHVPMPPNSTLDIEHFDTTGGVPPYPGADCLDPYTAAIASDFLSLWKLTSDPRWKTTALAMLEFSIQMIRRDEAPTAARAKMQPERFFYCPQSGLWGAVSKPAAWTATIITSSLLDISDAFPEIIRIEPDRMFISHKDKDFIRNAVKSIGTYINIIP